MRRSLALALYLAVSARWTGYVERMLEKRLASGNIAVVSTGFNDNTYTITVVTPAGIEVSNVTSAVPGGCTSPPHAIWVLGDENKVLFSCNGSDNIFVVDSGL